MRCNCDHLIINTPKKVRLILVKLYIEATAEIYKPRR